MHHQNGERAHEFQRKIAVGHTVQTVLRDAGKAELLRHARSVDRMRRAGERAAAERALVHTGEAVLQTGHVTPQHVGIGHHIVPESGRLCTLQMGIGGHDDRLPRLRRVHKRMQQREQLFADCNDLPFQIKTDIQRNLIVAAARCVQSLPCVTDALCKLRFHGHVDILRLGGEFNLARLNLCEDFPKAGDDLFRLLRLNDALRTEHAGMGNAARDVFPVHTRIKADGSVELLNKLIRIFLKTS